MTGEPSRYRRHRFHGEIISYAVWLYHLFSLSLRDIELILAERGVVVTRESIGTGVANLALTLPGVCVDAGLDPEIRGIWMRFSFA
jgi:transposase-like protein